VGVGDTVFVWLGERLPVDDVVELSVASSVPLDE
jgi:hypothetical protein